MRSADLPELADLLEHLQVVSIPMNTRFRGITTREIALLHGPAGWGEFSPFLEYGPPEASRWLASAIECAWRDWPAPVRDLVPVNATVPAVDAREVPAVLARFDGCRTAKVKVAQAGQRRKDDLDRVAAVREVMGPEAHVRVDANGGWDLAQATDALAALAAYDLEYAEQPCATVDELAALRRALARAGVDVPVAADESIRKADDPMRVVRMGAADVAVVKVAPLGGVHAALAIAGETGLPMVVSSALDSSVGIAAGVALAAALPQLPYACGLGTVNLFTSDVVADPLVPRHGDLPLRRPRPDAELLGRLEAPADRRAWWMQRVRDCYRELAG